MELVVYIDVSRSCYQEFNVDYVLDFTDLIFGITRMDTDEVKAKKWTNGRPWGTHSISLSTIESLSCDLWGSRQEYFFLNIYYQTLFLHEVENNGINFYVKISYWSLKLMMDFVWSLKVFFVLFQSLKFSIGLYHDSIWFFFYIYVIMNELINKIFFLLSHYISKHNLNLFSVLMVKFIVKWDCDVNIYFYLCQFIYHGTWVKIYLYQLSSSEITIKIR